MLNFCDFIQVYVFTTNHHLKVNWCIDQGSISTIFIFVFLFSGFGLLYVYSS